MKRLSVVHPVGGQTLIIGVKVSLKFERGGAVGVKFQDCGLERGLMITAGRRRLESRVKVERTSPGRPEIYIHMYTKEEARC